MEGGACTGPVQAAPAVAETCDPNATQSPAGGSISDGTYYVSAITVARSSPCSSVWGAGTTLQVSGNMLLFSYAPAPGIGETHEQYSFTTSGNQLTRTLLCDTDPNGSIGAMDTDGYTATTSTITLYVPEFGGGAPQNVTFTRR